MTPRIIIGFDPGVADTGYGVIKDEGGTLTCLDYGSIKTPAKTPLPERLETIYAAVTSLLKKHKPALISIEQLFFSKNVTTAMAVGQARGVVLLAAAQAKRPLVEFTPNQVKQSVASYGAADKQQVQRMVKMILKLKNIPKPDDAADALAIAICGAGKQL